MQDDNPKSDKNQSYPVKAKEACSILHTPYGRDLYNKVYIWIQIQILKIKNTLDPLWGEGELKNVSFKFDFWVTDGRSSFLTD